MMERKKKEFDTFHEVYDNDGVSYFDSNTIQYFTKYGLLDYFKDLNSVAVVNFFLRKDKNEKKAKTKFVVQKN
jgi:hypothetical protein